MTDDDEWVPSPLELAEQAHLAVRACWMWPADDDYHAMAIVACDRLGFDYVDRLFDITMSLGASIHIARREMAEQLRHRADEIYMRDGRLDDREAPQH